MIPNTRIPGIQLLGKLAESLIFISFSLSPIRQNVYKNTVLWINERNSSGRAQRQQPAHTK